MLTYHNYNLSSEIYLEMSSTFQNDKSILSYNISFFMGFSSILFLLFETSWIYYVAFFWWMLHGNRNGFHCRRYLRNKQAYLTKKYEKSFKFLTQVFLDEVVFFVIVNHNHPLHFISSSTSRYYLLWISKLNNKQ